MLYCFLVLFRYYSPIRMNVVEDRIILLYTMPLSELYVSEIIIALRRQRPNWIKKKNLKGVFSCKSVVENQQTSEFFSLHLLYCFFYHFTSISVIPISLYQCHAQTYSKLCKCISEQFANTSGLPIQKNVHSIICYS